MTAKDKPEPELVGLHVKVPKDMHERLLAYRDLMRKKNPMWNLSDAIRSLFEAGLKAVKR